jgi:hypothetical protein
MTVGPLYHYRGLLYRRGAEGVLMKCIHSATGKQLLDEIHAGQCGVHAASRTLVGKAFRSGFYWPTTKNDATKLARSARHANSYQNNNIYSHSNCRLFL